NWPVMKIALAEIPPWTFRGWSALIAGLTLLALSRLNAGATPPPPGAEWRGLAFATLFNVPLWNILSAYGVKVIAAGHAALLAYTMPLWVVLFSRLFLGEPIPRRSAARRRARFSASPRRWRGPSARWCKSTTAP